MAFFHALISFWRFEALRTGNVSFFLTFFLAAKMGSQVLRRGELFGDYWMDSHWIPFIWSEHSLREHFTSPILTKFLEIPSIVILGMDSSVTSRNGNLHRQTPQNRVFTQWGKRWSFRFPLCQRQALSRFFVLGLTRKSNATGIQNSCIYRNFYIATQMEMLRIKISWWIPVFVKA